MATFVTYLDFYVFLRQAEDLKGVERLYQAIISKIPTEISPEDSKIIMGFARNFISNLQKKWTAASRNNKTFMGKHVEWLESFIKWPQCESVDLKQIFQCHEGDDENIDMESTTLMEPTTSISTLESTTTKGQTRKAFSDLSNKQKKRRSGSLIDHSEEELIFALVTKLKSTGKVDLAHIIDHLEKNPQVLPDVKNLLFGKTKAVIIHEDQALALSTSLHLSKWQYLTMRSVLTDSNVPVLPSYNKLVVAKKSCYPPNADLIITEQCAKINLQALLDLTVQRIFKIPTTALDSLNCKNLKLISKWGFDGSSSQSNYKQKSDIANFDDSAVFMTSLVPLRLESNDLLLWENPNPSSTHYCRPVKFEFTKESTGHIKKEEAAMKEEIRNLCPTTYGEFNINHELHRTMVDGKVVTAVSDTPSAATCNICLAKPSEMNNLTLIMSKPRREGVYEFGLSTLHMWIRCMECLLHVSYRLDFEMWSARGINKELMQARKDLIQKQFRDQTGMLIDIVKQSFGTTNDGNTARRFFRDFEKTAEITKIDVRLIKRFAVVLQAISSGEPVNIEVFRNYCKETAELYVQLYSWYCMPASVHKLLIHGADICKYYGNLPIGIMSEEASEARNKDFRNTREMHSRKIGREQTNEDLFHSFLISSDPYISHIRPKMSRTKRFNLLPEAIELLIQKEDEEYVETEVLTLEAETIQDPLSI